MKRKLLLQLTLLAFGTFSSLHVFGQLSGYYQQDFEGTFPPSGWQTVDVLDPDVVWEKSNATFPDHYSGLYSAHINYTTFVDGEDWLILPRFTVAASDSFSFWLAADYLGYPPDTTDILVSTTDSNLSSFTTVLATLWDDTVGTSTYPPAADLFQYYAYSLSAFSGQNIYVAIRNRNNYGDGVYVDLVTIGTPPAIDAAAISIDVPNVVSTVSSIPKATVKNTSSSDQSFSVTMSTSGGYTSTQAVTDLVPGATQQIEFDPWSPVAGDVTISIQTQLVGDEIPENDTLSKVVTAYDPLSVYYQEDFEGAFPPPAWQTVDVLDPNSIWAQSSTYAYSGSNSAYIDYAFFVEGEDWLILPQFTVASTDSFSFWLTTNFPGGIEDSTYILVSTTDADPSSFTTLLATLSEGDNYPSTAGLFQYYAYSISAFAGQNIYVAFKNRNFFGDGVFVDLVSIGTPPPVLSVAALSIDVPDSVSLTPFSPMGSVINKSDSTQSFTVTMTITGGYTSTMDVTDLAPGAIQQVTFDPWSPVAGDATITLVTAMATDTIPSDDTVSKLIAVIGSDVAAYSIDVPVYVSTVTAVIPKATVKNYSLTDDQTFSVTMNITGGYTSTMNVTNLPAGETQQVDFDSWTPPSTGNFTVTIQTVLVDDPVPGNDTLSKVVTALDPLSGYYQQDFEADFFPPLGWQTVDAVDPDYFWEQDFGNAYSGDGSAHIHYAIVHGEDWLILPQWTTVTTDSVSFWLALDFTTYDDSTVVLVSTTDANLSSFTNVLGVLSDGVNYPLNIFTYQYYSFSLADYAGQNIYVALLNTNTNGDGVYIDLVSIGTEFGTGVAENPTVNSNVSSYPNPFIKSTSISFSLDQASTVKISMVDVMGKEVARLGDKTLPAGAQQITWNASGYPAGVYFCKINVNGKVDTQKLVKLN